MKIHSILGLALLSVVCVLVPKSRAQSVDSVLLDNFVFDSAGSPWVDGWTVLSRYTDIFTNDVPLGLNAKWSLQLRANSTNGVVDNFASLEFTGLRSGIYRATAWARSSHLGVGGWLGLVAGDSSFAYSDWVEITDTAWRLWTLTDTLQLNPSSPLTLMLDGGDSEVVFWETKFNNISLVKLSSNSGVAEQPATAGLTIDGSYPNPFSESTQIRFSLGESEPVNISVVNLLGDEVARIFEGVLGAGEHEFTWEPTSLRNGVYECVIQAGGKSERLTMVLLR